MPAPTTIKRVVNALLTQRRVILHLECKHNASIDELRFYAEPDLRFEVGDAFTCPFCPDPPAPPPQPERDPLDPLKTFMRGDA